MNKIFAVKPTANVVFGLRDPGHVVRINSGNKDITHVVVGRRNRWDGKESPVFEVVSHHTSAPLAETGLKKAQKVMAGMSNTPLYVDLQVMVTERDHAQEARESAFATINELVHNAEHFAMMGDDKGTEMALEQLRMLQNQVEAARDLLISLKGK